MKFNILDSLEDYTKKEEAVLNYKNKLKGLRDLSKEHILDAQKSFIDFNRSRIKFERAKERAALYKNKTEVIKYKMGINEADMLDMIKSYESLLDAVKEYWESLFEYHMTMTKLEILSGNKGVEKKVKIRNIKAQDIRVKEEKVIAEIDTRKLEKGLSDFEVKIPEFDDNSSSLDTKMSNIKKGSDVFGSKVDNFANRLEEIEKLIEKIERKVYED